ncbi:MAG: GDP-L-fucose synthase family protein [Bernardetiaceae bacterium]
MEKSALIYVAGHRGMVGSAILRRLQAEGYSRFLLRSSTEIDLRQQAAVTALFAEHRPDYVFLAAAKVGGILANNTYRADFLYDNLMISANVMEAAKTYAVKKLLFLGSSCIYPKHAPQPLREESLLSGLLEPTNEPYAIAKIAGIKLAENYRAQYGCNFVSLMPTNLYGPNDNYDLQSSHVLPALLRKFHQAKKDGDTPVVLWGSGAPRREFLHVDDLADACYFVMRHYDQAQFLNVGTGSDVTIYELAKTIQEIVGHQGEIVLDRDKPDGTPRKLLDVSRLRALGWQASTSLKDGIGRVYAGLAQTADWY